MLALVFLLVTATPEDAQAMRAFRAGNYDVACPLMLAIADHKKFDPWAWNDHALCSVKRHDFDGAWSSLQAAQALEKARRDEKLAAAVDFNRALLTKALLQVGAAKAPAVAVELARGITDCEQRLPLLVASQHLLDAELWTSLAACTDDRTLLTRALDNARRLGAPELEFIAEKLSVLPSPLSAATCLPLDPTSKARCGKSWVACTLKVVEEATQQVDAVVVIDAAQRSRWKGVAPTPEAPLVTFTSEGRRCTARDEHGELLDYPPASMTERWVWTEVDVCAATVRGWHVVPHPCEGGYQVFEPFERALHAVALPRTDQAK